MRGFELTEAKERFFFEGLGKREYPAQVVWGAKDKMLDARRRAEVADAVASLAG
jgi:hypothetical protein